MKKMKIAALGLAASLLLGGCSFMGEKVFFTFGNGIGNIFKIGDMGCPKKEALVYLANSYWLYGQSSSGSLWDMDIETSGLGDNIKTRVLKHLSMVYALNIYAREHDIELTDIEEEKITKAADEYISTLSDNDIEYLKVNPEDVVKMYENLVTAKKVYADLMSSVDAEVSEDECRVMKAYLVKVSDEETAGAVEKEINSGTSFETIASSYSEDQKGATSFGRGELPASVEEAAFSLDNGEATPMIKDSDSYYFVYCIEKYDKELSELNKNAIIEARKEAVINDIVAQQNSEYYSGLDEKKWDEISPIPDEGVTTDKFFDIISEYVSY